MLPAGAAFMQSRPQAAFLRLKAGKYLGWVHLTSLNLGEPTLITPDARRLETLVGGTPATRGTLVTPGYAGHRGKDLPCVRE